MSLIDIKIIFTNLIDTMNINLTMRHGCVSEYMHNNPKLNLKCHSSVSFKLSSPRQLLSTMSRMDRSKTGLNHWWQHNRFTIARATLTSELPPPESDDNQKEERNPLFTGPNPTIILAGFYLEELPAIRQLLDAAGGHNITLVPSMPWLLDLPLHRALAEGEPQWDQPMPQTWVQGGGWGQRRVALFNDIASLAQGTILTMFESSPVGKVCALATTEDDMEADLGDVLAKATDAACLEKEPTMDFVESMEALPPIETVMGDTVQQLKRDKAGIFEENDTEKEELGGMSGRRGDGDGFKSMDDDVIDKIAAEFLNN